MKRPVYKLRSKYQLGEWLLQKGSGRPADIQIHTCMFSVVIKKKKISFLVCVGRVLILVIVKIDGHTGLDFLVHKLDCLHSNLILFFFPCLCSVSYSVHVSEDYPGMLFLKVFIKYLWLFWSGDLKFMSVHILCWQRRHKVRGRILFVCEILWHLVQNQMSFPDEGILMDSQGSFILSKILNAHCKHTQKLYSKEMCDNVFVPKTLNCLFLKVNSCRLIVVAYNFDFSIWEAEADWSRWVLGQPSLLQSEFQEPISKKQNRKTNLSGDFSKLKCNHIIFLLFLL